MIVLTRRTGEAVVLHTADGPITVRVVRTDPRKGSMRLAFDAPPSVVINRQEVDERIQAGAPKP